MGFRPEGIDRSAAILPASAYDSEITCGPVPDLFITGAGKLLNGPTRA
jgi:hypothetical protein